MVLTPELYRHPNLTPNSLTETGDDKDLDQYISEDQETEMAQNRKTAQQVQTAILWDLHQVLGVDATLPENASKELILQVMILIIITTSYKLSINHSFLGIKPIFLYI